MNREIEFRGKRVDNGEWVYGWYYESVNYFDGSTKPMIIWINQVPSSIDRMIPAFEMIEWEVIPETVGQYTGLKDKNGKEIFEGSTLKYNHKDWTYKGEVYYSNRGTWDCDSFLLGDINEQGEVIEINNNPKLIEEED